MAHKTDVPNLGSFLKSSRVRLGLSQREVADRLGHKSAQTVSDWERGAGSPPSPHALKQLASIYNIDPDFAFDILLQHHFNSIESKLRKEYQNSK